MKNEFRVKEKCKSCDGTGIYVGIGERDGFGVVCHTCKGTGCYEFVHIYEEFELKIIRSDVKQVVKTNPGISLGVNSSKGFTLESFGGISYNDWVNGKSFPEGSEMRDYVCPAWWYQSADYDKKPNWEECGFGTFSSCKHFCNKNECWRRFDSEKSFDS